MSILNTILSGFSIVFSQMNMEKTNLLVYTTGMKEYKETAHTLLYKSTSDLTIYSAGYEECSPDYSYGPRIRSYHVIHFILSGKGALHINQHIYECQEGDVFIIPAGKVSFYQASSTDPWCYAWLNFLGINSEMYVYQLMTSSDDIYVLHGLEMEKYKKSIFEILSILSNNTSSYFRANSILLRIMSYLYEDVGFQEENWGKISIADEIKFYLDMKYSEKIKLQDVAKKFGIHPNYMTRIFHEKYGVSPKQYLMDVKLKKACRLLTTTELSVSVIASSLGFDDQLAFSKIFKKEFAISPTEYRKQSRISSGVLPNETSLIRTTL